MGEAKRRRASDTRYGKVPKAGKGIVVSPPIRIEANGTLNINTQMDPVELRRAVLFWDRISRPQNNIIAIGLSPEELFLQECGILQETLVSAKSVSGMAGPIYAQLHLNAFLGLESKEPGTWVLSEGPNSFDYRIENRFKQGRGALVELHRAIPLPTQDVTLEDLLEFKRKRSDEILSLRLELDGLFSRISKAEDAAFEMQRAIAEIDKKCADIIAVGRESAISFALSNFSYGVSLDINSTNLLAGSFLGGIMGSTFGLPVVGSAIGVAASTLKLQLSWGGKLERSKKAETLALSPYRVASSLINHPI